MAKETFYSSKELQDAIDHILSTPPFAEIDKHDINVVALFSDKANARNAGYCRLLPPAVRAATDIHYVIVIRQPILEAYDFEQKAKLLIHECHHIEVEEEENGEVRFKARRHSPSFCTYPTHEHADSLVTKTYMEIKDIIAPFIKKLPHQEAADFLLTEYMAREN